jgi:hypothetical protein
VTSAPATETVTVPPEDFLARWAFDNPAVPDATRALMNRWLLDPTERVDVAVAEGMSLGALLRSFNETAPLAEPLDFRYRDVGFTVRAMPAICDDVVGDRFPKFGAPVTLRVYYADPTLLPQGMYEAADWNFMDAGLPGYLGYAYGVRYENTLYLAGMQSDLAVRYAYLFQNRGGGTEVRAGDEVTERPATEESARFGTHVPVLRRTFQRYWIQVLLGAVVTWADTEPELTHLGLLWFPLEQEEDRDGHVVRRVYRQLPERLGTSTRWVETGAERHRYRTTTLADARVWLGDQLNG